jgi:predicted amino acid dehydrogenase
MTHKLKYKKIISPEILKSQLPSSGGMGFLFHPTDWHTLSFIYENTQEKSPDFEKELWEMPPFIASEIYYDNKVIGANIIMPVPIEMWINSPNNLKKFRQKHFFPALELINSCNIKIVGMGASTPYVCNYGMIERPLETPFLTTGHAATSAMLKKWVINACDKTNCNYEKIKLAIFGASGRLGKAVSNFIASYDPPQELILIDLEDKKNLLKNHAEELLQKTNRKDLKILTSHFNSHNPIPDFDGAIIVSNNSVPFLTTEDLKKAKFWIDDSHPRGTSVEAEIQSRNHTLYIECYVRGPEKFNTNFPFRLPTNQDCYTCCAEGFVAWQENINQDFIVGIPDANKVKKVDDLLDKYNFKLGPLSGKNGDLI